MGLCGVSPSPLGGFVRFFLARILPVILLAAALGGLAAPVEAANCKWTGSSDGLWSNPDNWSYCGAGNIPAASDTVEIPFSLIPSTDPLLNLPSVSIASLTIGGGRTLTLGGNTSLSVPDISLDGHLNLGSHTLTLPATSSLTLNDSPASIEAGLLVIQPGPTFSLVNNGAINANLEIGAGASAVSGIGQAAGTVTIDTGAVLTVPFHLSFTISGPITNNGSITGGGALVAAGAISNNALASIDVNQLQLKCSLPRQLSGSGAWHSDTLEVFGACQAALANDMTWPVASLVVDNNGTLDLGTHTLTLNTATNLSLGGAYAFIAGSGSLVFQGAVSLNFNAGGRIMAPLVVTSAGSQVTDVGNGVLTDVTLQTGANLNNQSPQNLDVIGVLTIQTGASLTGSGSLSFSGSTLANNGMVSSPVVFLGGASQSASGNGSYTANVTVYNNTTLALSGSPILNNLLVVASGTLHLMSMATLTLAGSGGTPLIVYGSLIQDDTAFVVYKGTSTQQAAGISFKNLVIQNSVGVTLTGPVSVTKNLYLFGGVLNNTSYVLTISNSEIRRSAGSLSAPPSFSGSIDVVYFASIPITTGFELPISPASVGTLEVNDVAGVTLASNLTVTNYLKLTSGPLVIQSHTLTITATNWERTSGALSSAPTGSVVYNAPAAGQSIISTQYGNLSVSGGSKIANDANIIVTGNLALGAEVTVTSGLRITLNSGATTSGSFDVFGLVTRYGPFSPSTVYSFGNPSVSISFTSAGTLPDRLDAALSKTTPAGLWLALPRTYAITASGGSGYSATLRLHYYPSELGSIPPAKLAVWKPGPGPQPWILAPAAAYDGSAGWVQVNGVTSFSTFALAPNYPYRVFLPAAKK